VSATFLVTPANGSTNVSDRISSVKVTGPTDGTFSLRASDGSSTILSKAAAGSTQGQLLALPLLEPKTTYALLYAPPQVSDPCGSHETSGTIGTFTTAALP